MNTKASEREIVIVSGGLGLIGHAIVKKLLENGQTVLVIDSRESTLNSNEFFYKKSPDIWDIDSIYKLAEEIETEYGNVTGLINCMATRTQNSNNFFSSLENSNLETWDEVLKGNLTNTFLLCREIGLRMVSRRFGSIVNFGSIYGPDMGADQRIYLDSNSQLSPMNTPAAYSISKGGVVALTKHLATLWASSGVRVNCVSPGGVLNNQGKTFIDAYSNRIPMGRMAEVFEIIGLPIFLIGAESTYITGQNFYIDGGLSSW